MSTQNSSSEVWADSAYRSQKNEKWLASRMLISRIHRRKPAGKPMPHNIARANAAKSAIRAHVEHVFAHQKNRFGLFIRTRPARRLPGRVPRLECHARRNRGDPDRRRVEASPVAGKARKS
ncbi:MAG TPA: transposase family protein [Acidiphilium sp.]|nr:transposase family protein [Acidiphilium sp.]